MLKVTQLVNDRTQLAPSPGALSISPHCLSECLKSMCVLLTSCLALAPRPGPGVSLMLAGQSPPLGAARTMSNWHPQPSLQLGLGHWMTVPLTGPMAVDLDLGGRGLVSEAADGEESALAVGCIHSPCPTPLTLVLPGDLKARGRRASKPECPLVPAPTSKTG